GFPRLRRARPALALRRPPARARRTGADLDGAERPRPRNRGRTCRPDHLRGAAMSGGEPVVARLGDGVARFDAAEWDACAGTDNPLLSHAVLAALEESGSATAETGWQPLPVAIDGPDGRPEAVMPAYVKSHSQGEYVFDHAWADAWHRAGGAYYPKLQIAVPFTPVPGRRLLTRPAGLAPALIAAAERIVEANGLSSAHATFIAPREVPTFEAAGWLIRTDSQFHWTNQDYASFDDFLAALSSRKRKAIRK